MDFCRKHFEQVVYMQDLLIVITGSLESTRIIDSNQFKLTKLLKSLEEKVCRLFPRLIMATREKKVIKVIVP